MLSDESSQLKIYVTFTAVEAVKGQPAFVDYLNKNFGKRTKLKVRLNKI